MAIGDDATQQGFPLVPDSGPEGLVRYGSREINRTRDFVAQLKRLIPGSKSAARSQAGISSGTTVPSNGTGADGDIYLQIL